MAIQGFSLVPAGNPITTITVTVGIPKGSVFMGGGHQRPGDEFVVEFGQVNGAPLTLVFKFEKNEYQIREEREYSLA